MSFPFRPLTSALALGLLVTASACDSNGPGDDPGDQELITRVVVTMTNTADASDVRTIAFTDLDGDGGDAPVFAPASVTLQPGATFDATIRLEDTINDESITDEIAEEAEEHLFAYAFSPASAGTVTLTDRESQYGANTGADLPVGLTFRVVVAPSATGTGTFNATLFHFDDGALKNSGMATSDERDIDIDFPIAFGGPALTAVAGR